MLMFRAHRSLVVQMQNFLPCFVLYTMRYAPPSIDRGINNTWPSCFFFVLLHSASQSKYKCVNTLYLYLSRKYLQMLSNHDFHSYYKFPQNIASAQNKDHGRLGSLKIQHCETSWGVYPYIYKG